MRKSSHGLPVSPLRPERVRGRLSSGLLALVAGALGLGALQMGCVPPGMKFTLKPAPGETEIKTKVDGQDVTLRTLTPQVLKSLSTPAGDGIKELLVSPLPPYKVGPQDILLVTVWDHPEITLPLGQYRTDTASGMVVDEDGNMFFPYVGKFRVGGLTTTQVRERLTGLLAGVLKNPQVDVKVIAFRSQKVYVDGEVKAPASLNVTDVPFTLAEAINRAGGFLSTADDSRLILSRGDRKWRLDYQSLILSGNRVGQILLQDGDSLHIPHIQEEPVYLLGEIARPGTQPLYHGHLTLAQAMVQAGGISGNTSDARSVYVVRQGATPGSVDVYLLDARTPTAMALADRFPLAARDIVYVDGGTLVRWSRVMSLLLPTLNAVTTSAYEIKYVTKN